MKARNANAPNARFGIGRKDEGQHPIGQIFPEWTGL